MVVTTLSGSDMVVFLCAIVVCIVPDFVHNDMVMVGERCQFMVVAAVIMVVFPRAVVVALISGFVDGGVVMVMVYERR
jgi:hypothetical protein